MNENVLNVAVKTQDDLTLRDWFAGQALVGLAESARERRTDDIMHDMLTNVPTVTGFCYILADAMLAAREK